MMSREVSDAAVPVEQRRNRHLVPKHRAVLAIVSQQHAARLPLRQRLAQSVAPILFAIVALQEPEVAADKLRRGITRQGLESGIDVEHRLLGILGIHERNSVGRALDQAPIDTCVKGRHDYCPSTPAAV